VAFKVNYGLKKAERDRAKKAKKEAKARERDSGSPVHVGQGGQDEPAADSAAPDAITPTPES
jgi:hypothetical protein